MNDIKKRERIILILGSLAGLLLVGFMLVLRWLSIKAIRFRNTTER